MLTKKQVEAIREHLEKAQNPVFFFDNDADGLCSFLILQRYIQKGKGVVIKSFPELTGDYFRKVRELDADYVFVLDKPRISKEFFEEIENYNIPIVWIDHHETQQEIPNFVNYYNILSFPTTFLCYKVSEKKEDLWLAVTGCVADRYLPDFYEDFKKEYPELSIDSNDAYDIRYKAKIGEISRILDFALKDKTTNVVNMLRFLMKVRSPFEVLEENPKNYSMHKRFFEINKKYKKVLDKAINLSGPGKLLFFKYGGEIKFTQNLSDELCYLFPKKIVVVAYVDSASATISVRGENVRKTILDILSNFENSSGGGHENSVGCKVDAAKIGEFEKRIREAFS